MVDKHPSLPTAWCTIISSFYMRPESGASIAHSGNLLISLPLTGFLSFPVSFLPPSRLCFLDHLPNTLLVSGPTCIYYFSIMWLFCVLFEKQPSAEIKVKELCPHSLHLHDLDLWKCLIHSFQ